MKKAALSARIDETQEELERVERRLIELVRGRTSQIDRILADADHLTKLADEKLRELDEKVRRGERIEADYIDPKTTRGAIREIAAILGVEETTTGRFVGGYDAIVERVRALQIAAEKKAL